MGQLPPALGWIVLAVVAALIVAAESYRRTPR
jgi:hypothetical protein